VPDSAALFASLQKQGAGATAQSRKRFSASAVRKRPTGKQKIKFETNRSSQSGGAGVLRWSLAFQIRGRGATQA
jgi:hypothetical protein